MMVTEEVQAPARTDAPAPSSSSVPSGVRAEALGAGREAATRARDRLARIAVPPLVATADAAIVLSAFALAYVMRFEWQIAPEWCEVAPPEPYLKASVLVTYCWLVLFRFQGLYDFSRSRSPVDTTQAIWKALLHGLAIVLSLTYFYREFSFSRLVCVYAWGISLVLLCVFRIVLERVKEDFHRRGVCVRRALIIGSGSLARFLVSKLRSRPELGYEVIGAVDDDPLDAGPGCPLVGSLRDVEAIVRRDRVDRVLVAHPVLGHLELLEVIATCERLGVELGMVPPTYDLRIVERDFEEVDGVPLVAVNERDRVRAYDWVKRGFDLVLSSVALVVVWPVLLVAGLLVRLEDGGPAFFRQTRVGKDGRLFRMWKLRTMVPDAESRLGEVIDLERLERPVFKVDRDPRVTRVGRWLRRTSLDELPQLLNVLRGEMSLVGPRPEEERVVARYGVHERRRLKALPGLTGLQQVECRGSTDLDERIRLDVTYLRKRSLLLDLWILAKTVWVVARGHGAR